ncbi:hypothetical protein AB9F46_36500, partial [Rhizobium leguminosarum]
ATAERGWLWRSATKASMTFGEAKRQAVAALSQFENMPAAVALFIGNQPIEIAAPFLAASSEEAWNSGMKSSANWR